MSALILSTDAAAGLRRPHADLSAALDDGHEFRYCLFSYSSRPRGLKRRPPPKKPPVWGA